MANLQVITKLFIYFSEKQWFQPALPWKYMYNQKNNKSSGVWGGGRRGFSFFIYLPSPSSCFYGVSVIICVGQRKVLCIGAEQARKHRMSLHPLQIFVCVPIHKAIHQCGMRVKVYVEVYCMFLNIKMNRSSTSFTFASFGTEI